MRVLHMIPDIGVSNGIMSVILNMAKAMPDDIKFDLVYFMDKPEDRREDIERLGGRVFKIDRPSLKSLGSKEMSGFFKAHKGEWSALHIHAPHFAPFIAPDAKKAGIKKICVHCHSTEFSLKGNSKRNKMLALWARNNIKDKFACSHEAGKMWYGSKPFTVLNNAIDCEKYVFDEKAREDERKSLGIEKEAVFCHIGRTDIPQKNHKFLIETFIQIHKKLDSRLLLIGAVENDGLKALCKEGGVENDVLFLGMRDDVAKLLSAGDVFLFPSTKEGLPLSVIEAQASGMPVLMSSSITDEVAVTRLVTSLSLDEGEKKWTDTALSLLNRKREDTSSVLKSAGWDIHTAYDKLIEYYRR